jgi:hypothetical protein
MQLIVMLLFTGLLPAQTAVWEHCEPKATRSIGRVVAEAEKVLDKALSAQRGEGTNG